MTSSNARLQTQSEEVKEDCFLPLRWALWLGGEEFAQRTKDSLSADGLPILRKNYLQGANIKANELEPPC